MSGEGWTADELAGLVVAQIEDRIGGIEDVSLTALHVEMADQVIVMLRAGATAADIDPIITEVWRRLREEWERVEGLPEQTHRNRTAYVS